MSRRPWMMAYVVISAVLWTGGFALIARRSPGLIRERMRPGAGAVEGLGEEAVLYALPALAHWVLVATDRPGRPWWRPMPAWLHAIGLLGYTLANLVVIWAEVSNRFFSSAVRIQEDRDQYVISDGPYAFVRHPGYAGGVGLFVASSFATGSWLSLVPALIFGLTIFRRMGMEDAFLQANLPGYDAYANQVRSRLVPGVW